MSLPNDLPTFTIRSRLYNFSIDAIYMVGKGQGVAIKMLSKIWRALWLPGVNTSPTRLACGNVMKGCYWLRAGLAGSTVICKATLITGV